MFVVVDWPSRVHRGRSLQNRSQDCADDRDDLTRAVCAPSVSWKLLYPTTSKIITPCLTQQLIRGVHLVIEIVETIDSGDGLSIGVVETFHVGDRRLDQIVWAIYVGESP